CGATFKEMRDVGMIEAGENLPLIAKAADDVLAFQPGAKEFDRNLFLILIVRAARKVDRSHSSMADFAQQLIVADEPPGFTHRVLLVRRQRKSFSVVDDNLRGDLRRGRS